MITAQKIDTTKPVALVAGGAGFIGSFLCEALLLQNCRVICVDNLTTGKKENLKKCFSNKDFVFIKHDLTTPLPPEIRGEKISYIFSLTDKEFINKNLWQLASENRAKLLIVSWGYFRPETFSEKLGGDVRIVNFVDVYGPRMKLENIESLAQRLSKNNSLFITDAVFGIIKAMFAPGTSGKIFHLTNEGEKKLKWRPQVSLENGIEQTLKFFQEKKVSPPKERLSWKGSPLVNFKILTLVLAFILLIFLWPFLWGGLNGFLGIKYFQKAEQSFLLADFKKGVADAKKAEMFFEKGEKIGKPFKLGKELTQGLTQAVLVADKASVLSNFIFQNSNEDINRLISETKIGLDQSYFYFSLAEGELKNPTLINQTAKFFGFQSQINELKQKIPEIKNFIIQGREGIKILPWLIGLEQKRTFLVLLQNNNELRPTGGFIGSFALLTFEKGKFLDFEVQDVYWADGQLKGHVEPPTTLKKYLGEANWYLRDSNWEPDFPTSAVKAQWFLEKEIGRVVDGVVGVNLLVAQRLLEAVGEVELPDYKEKINAANLFERAQYYSEIGFFPGSTQKEDFLGSLARVLFEKIKRAEGKTQIEIAKVIYQSLKSKDILIFLNDSQSMKVISDLNWDGRVRDVEAPGDYLMMVEANVGVNKANYFVKRELNHNVEIKEDGEVVENLKIIYQNDSPSENFPAGKYRNYLRILVPLESELIKVLINDQELAKEKIEIEKIASKTSFGFLVEVPIREKVEAEIFYRLPKKIELTSKSQYFLLVQKQPGTKNEEFKLKISVPVGVAVLPVKPTAVLEDNVYVFNQNFEEDLVFDMFLVR